MYPRLSSALYLAEAGLELLNLLKARNAVGTGGRKWGGVGDPSSLSCPIDGIYEIGGLLPVWAVVVIVGTALASVTFFVTSNREPPRLHWVRTGGL